MKRVLSFGLIVVIAALSGTGCGLPGRWQSVAFDPEVTRADYHLFGEVSTAAAKFTEARVNIGRDGAYAAEIYYDQQLYRSAGQWRQTDGKLIFVDNAGTTFTYSYVLSEDRHRLTLISRIGDTDVVLTLKRKM